LSARILPFPQHRTRTVRVVRERDGDGWLVLWGSHGWVFGSRGDAIEDALELGAMHGVDVFIENGEGA
jgi:hypothetical protein